MQYFLQKVNNIVPYGTSARERVELGLLLLILWSIPFSVRYVFENHNNYLTGAYSDFTSISLYLSDILVVGFIILRIPYFKHLKALFALPIAYILIELVVNKGQFSQLQQYFSLRLLIILIFTALLSQYLLNQKFFNILSVHAVVIGSIQSLIANYQFIYQKSLGLFFLGESHLSAEMYGVAKIVAHGTKLIRGYGTFPHPNLLSAFLVFTTLLNLYLLTRNYQKLPRILLTLTLFLNILGLFSTLSRGGVTALGLSVGFYLILLLYKRDNGIFRKILLATGLTTAAAAIIFFPYLSPRATISDNAVKERYFYNQIGKRIIEDKFFLGTGVGTSVLHMEQYAGVKLEPWEIQPVHNYYLLSFVEWGIGSIFLLALIIYPVYLNFRKTLSKIKTSDMEPYWMLTVFLIGIAFLYLFFFDHYFYTIWPTQLLLWIVIGISFVTANNFNNKPDSNVPR